MASTTERRRASRSTRGKLTVAMKYYCSTTTKSPRVCAPGARESAAISGSAAFPGRRRERGSRFAAFHHSRERAPLLVSRRSPDAIGRLSLRCAESGWPTRSQQTPSWTRSSRSLDAARNARSHGGRRRATRRPGRLLPRLGHSGEPTCWPTNWSQIGPKIPAGASCRIGKVALVQPFPKGERRDSNSRPPGPQPEQGSRAHPEDPAFTRKPGWLRVLPRSWAREIVQRS